MAQHWALGFAIRVVGAAYLPRLEMFRYPPERRWRPQAIRRGWLANFVQELISASNPKVILFYIAFSTDLHGSRQTDRRGDMAVASLLTVPLP